ncbi:DDE-type integrase/transposase/recombinase [Ruegeria sp. HKCCD5849]|nr:DDE-type integrase/transposase/recombinase [Ruegeria sp. HKCCD7296]NOD47783.1 DDE-type integrase/transposase/recombinase [Ruegeria sp. HKCCD5849]NOD52554.1 DDE-type integrase/transposase/recombinase [Ruegeria sp. HKCCD5851]NOD65973.1 DDE-type integrase/transposase/recombinase [Ruegeria sp. HKCCD7303]NOE34409.1 DDE-type integrase/transposase/recombinase [Ruegeria sp. HKCCD7318]NOE40109.1 DDE-type integrase/transposase/recombinase [Ruegeria sp. HKCCD7319]
MASGYGNTLDLLVQKQRNAKAARRFLQRFKSAYEDPLVVISDKLRGYFEPVKSLAPSAKYRSHKVLSNRAEQTHLTGRKRQKIVGRFKLPSQAQRFLAAQDHRNAQRSD